MRWLKHAFAVEEPGPIEPTDQQRAVVDKLCAAVVRRHLTTPALLLLEMGQPLNYVTSQALHFFTPIVCSLTDAEGYRHFAAFLERRGSIEYLIRRIDEVESAAARRESVQAHPPKACKTSTVLPADDAADRARSSPAGWAGDIDRPASGPPPDGD